MAVCISSSPSPRLQSRTRVSQPSISCVSKVSVGSRTQSSNIQFFNTVYTSIESRTRDSKPTRGRVTMMPIGVPRVLYRNRVEGTWQWIDLWNALYRERIIFIGGQFIKEDNSNQIVATMLYLDSVDDYKDLYLYLNGSGGEINPTMAIYDTMESLKSPIGTLCLGYAFSPTSIILAGGEKGKRAAVAGSTITLGSPGGSARGQADDIRNEADALIGVRDYLFKELAKKTGQPIEKIHKDLSPRMTFDADEAVEYGIIDKVIRPRGNKKEAAEQAAAREWS